MARIACLHTAASNVAVFDAAARGLDVTLIHHVRADLLAEAEALGGLSEDLRTRTRAALRDAAIGADSVLLTCSTLGPCAPDQRVDAALARAAVRGGGIVAVLCAVATTLTPSEAVFAEAARATGATIRMQLVPGAWAAFRAGDQPGYVARIADAARMAVHQGAEVVALAQASMAGAQTLLPPDFPVLTSPSAGLHAALATLEHNGASA